MGRFDGHRIVRELCLWLALMLAGLALVATHAEQTDGYACAYAVRPDGTAEITGWLGEGELAEIPGEIDGLKVTAVGDRAFEGCEGVARIVLPEGLEALGDGAFSDCYSLEEIHIPATVARVGQNPFAGCENLKRLDLADGQRCLSLVNGVLFADGGARLVFCPRMLPMERYVAPEGIERIDDRAFSYCNRLLSVALPDSVTQIGDNAFERRANLTLTVVRGSYGEAFARQNDIKYTYPDSAAWLADGPM